LSPGVLAKLSRRPAKPPVFVTVGGWGPGSREATAPVAALRGRRARSGKESRPGRDDASRADAQTVGDGLIRFGGFERAPLSSAQEGACRLQGPRAARQVAGPP
jgi:hypothetical protein